MNVLFMNRDNGAGVEFEGNLFIDILRRVVGVNSIDVYKSQCKQTFKSFDFSVYDLIILNDLSMGEYDQRKFDVGKPVININFGGVGNRSEVVDIVLDINLPYTSHYERNILNYYPINFISGNIWHNNKRLEDRSNDILYVSRLAEGKVMPKFLEYVRSVNKVIDFYGPITDEEYYNKNRDVIDYKGYISHRDLLDVYNNYRAVYLFSTTECLSMTVREAILCGTVPVVYDDINFTKAIKEYTVHIGKDCSFPGNIDEILLYKHERIIKDSVYLNNYLSFDKMILDFIFCLRGLLLKNLKFNKKYKARVNILHEEKDRDDITHRPYENDSVNWDNINL